MSLLRSPAPWLAAVLVGTTAFAVGAGPAAVDDTAQRPAPQALQLANDLSTAFEHAAERVSRSVVSIHSTVRPQLPTRGRGGSPFQGTPFERFFDGRSFELDGQAMPRTGLGSGFVLDADGHIVTNNHVVQGADQVQVTLPDQRTLEAKVIGTDPKTDLAVLKIDADGLDPVELGDSDALRIGQWVIAAGNPFGLNATITAGIVSAKGRSQVGLSDYEDFIQTDAAINPGNSGGPLVDLHGRVVGISSAIFTRTGGSMGIGFAIPVGLAKPVLDSLIENGRVDRGWLGVGIQDLDSRLRRARDFDGEGVLVGQVVEGGPADAAGIDVKDIVTRIDGKPMRSQNQLRNFVAALRPGSEVEVEIYRDGKTRTVTLEIGKQPQDLDRVARGRTGGNEPRGRTDEKLGLTVRDVSAELAAEYGLDRDERGALVVSVESGSPAEAVRLLPGDLIVQVGDAEIESAKDLVNQLADHDLEEGVELVVRNGDSQRIVFVQIGG